MHTCMQYAHTHMHTNVACTLTCTHVATIQRQA